jgi:hypothetical protein
MVQLETWLFVCRGRVLLSSRGWPGTYYIAHASLKRIILLQPPECWDYRHAPLCLCGTWLLISVLAPIVDNFE